MASVIPDSKNTLRLATRDDTIRSVTTLDRRKHNRNLSSSACVPHRGALNKTYFAMPSDTYKSVIVVAKVSAKYRSVELTMIIGGDNWSANLPIRLRPTPNVLSFWSSLICGGIAWRSLFVNHSSVRPVKCHTFRSGATSNIGIVGGEAGINKIHLTPVNICAISQYSPSAAHKSHVSLLATRELSYDWWSAPSASCVSRNEPFYRQSVRFFFL